MKVNGDSIYSTTANPLNKQPSWGRVTQKGNKLYLHVFDWPKDGKLVVDLPSLTVTNAYLLANSQKLELNQTQTDHGVDPYVTTIDLPSEPIDPIDTVIVLNTKRYIIPD